MRTCVARLLVLSLLLMPGAVPAVADAYRATPKLVVVLVIDQFRGDYLDRYRDDFKTANGFNLFLKKGVHFTDCYYDYANLVTAAGALDHRHGKLYRWPRNSGERVVGTR